MPDHDVVVVGASAGGVQALRTLVAGLPPTFAAAVLVVLHIPPHTTSQLHSILDRVSALPVSAAEDGTALVPGHIYVAPTDRHLLVEKDCVRITRGPRENRMRPAVDSLFRSAAYAFGPRAIAIVLTGMLDDGTAGAWAIKDRGGMVVVQAPADAEYPSMPESVIQHVVVDAALPVAEIPALLVRLTGRSASEPAPPSEALQIETRIALEGNALLLGSMRLGVPSSNSCPDCHGVMVRIHEGSIVRYRCHTGHAYSLQTLLSEVDEEIDKTLWSALRAIEERILLLREMEQSAAAQQDVRGAQRYAEQARATEQHVTPIREMVLDHSLFGRISGLNDGP